MHFLTSPVSILGENNAATSVLCVKIRLGPPDETGRPTPIPIKGSEYLESADMIITASGQYSDISFLPKELGISTAGTIIINHQTMETNLPGVFSGGDAVSGPDVFVNAVAAGRKAAISIDRYLRGKQITPVFLHPTTQTTENIPVAMNKQEKRIKPDYLPVKFRHDNFKEVESAFSEHQAWRESKRCLGCGICGHCYRGNENGWACDWFQTTGSMDRNNYCGLCMECVKTCPHDNIGLFVRPFASETVVKGYDEAWKGFIMLTLAIVYSIMLLGPWGTVKDWANVAESGQVLNFLKYVGILWCSALVLLPSIYYCFVRLSKWLSQRQEIPTKQIFLGYAFTLIPLGLMAWIAFSVPLVMVNGAYMVSVISDPMGWGWDLLGTAHIPWTPIYPEFVPHIQMILMLVGLYIAVKSAYKIGLRLFQDKQTALKSLIPIAAFLLLVTLVFFRLFAG